jgi:hypothetical protein
MDIFSIFYLSGIFTMYNQILTKTRLVSREGIQRIFKLSVFPELP